MLAFLVMPTVGVANGSSNYSTPSQTVPVHQSTELLAPAPPADTSGTSLTCGVHSYLTSELKCQCEEGYIWKREHSSNLDCTRENPEDVCYDTKNGYLGDDDKCYCNNRYEWDNKKMKCVRGKDVCTVKYGSHSQGSTELNADGIYNCYCKDGYKWNSAVTKCITNKELTVAKKDRNKIDSILINDQLNELGVVEENNEKFLKNTPVIHVTFNLSNAEQDKIIFVKLLKDKKIVDIVEENSWIKGDAVYTADFYKPEEGWQKGPYDVEVKVGSKQPQKERFRISNK